MQGRPGAVWKLALSSTDIVTHPTGKSHRAHYLICFRLPTLNLHLQAVLQPTSTVAPLFSFINVMPEVTHTNAATRFPLRSLAINKCNP